jgi:O-antigen/teichoic acid export membrane protein
MMTTGQQSTNLAKKIAVDSSRLLGSSMANRVLGMFAGFVSASILGPNDYGLLKIINLIPTLVTSGSFDFDIVAQREVLHLRGTGASPEQEQHVKSVAFTADLIWVGVIALIVVAFSFSYERPEVRYGMWLAAISLVLAQITRLYYIVAGIDKRFSLVAFISMLGGFTQSVFVLTTVYWLRIYGLLLAKILADLVNIFSYRRFIQLGARPSFDRQELFRQLRIGLPFAVSALGYGLYEWIERLQVLNLYGAEQLGVYMLSVTVFDAGLMFNHTVAQATNNHLYEQLSREDGEERESHGVSAAQIMRIPSLIWAYLAPLFGFGMWLTAPPVILWLLPAYAGMLPLLFWVGIALTLRGVTTVPLAAMRSARLNMQNQAMIMQWVATIVFAGILFAGARLGLGIEAAAIARTATFLAWFLIVYGLVWPFFFDSRRALAVYLAPDFRPAAAGDGHGRGGERPLARAGFCNVYIKGRRIHPAVFTLSLLSE